MTTTLARHDGPPVTRLHNDPRRPGRAMIAVWCFCGRFYTATPENILRSAHNHERPCPSCGPIDYAAKVARGLAVAR